MGLKIKKPNKEAGAKENEVDPKHYKELGHSKKDIHSVGEGLFIFPQTEKGAQQCGLRPFLTFYFDDEESYQKALDLFDKNQDTSKKTPYANTEKLMEMIKAFEDKGRSGNE